MRDIYQAIRDHNNDPRYDINGNGRVEFGDLHIAMTQLGRQCRRDAPRATLTKVVLPDGAEVTPKPAAVGEA